MLQLTDLNLLKWIIPVDVVPNRDIPYCALLTSEITLTGKARGNASAMC
ncbi:TPA: hypothetical protein ACUNCA_002922 [Enterobacter ludwigii]